MYQVEYKIFGIAKQLPEFSKEAPVLIKYGIVPRSVINKWDSKIIIHFRGSSNPERFQAENFCTLRTFRLHWTARLLEK